MAHRAVNSRPAAAQVCAELNRAGAKYLVIGGVACALHGYVRATQDVDILIERTAENGRHVLKALAKHGVDFARSMRPEDLLRRAVTVFGGDPAVGVFTVAGGVRYEQVASRAPTIRADGVAIPLIGLDDLIESKRTGRLQDAADIEALEEIKRLRGAR